MISWVVNFSWCKSTNKRIDYFYPVNFLGHAYFSTGRDDQFLAGNTFGDFIKGKVPHGELPDGIIKGIEFHRFLDIHGDQCPSFVKLRELLGHDFGHYRGVIADIFIDHLLAAHWEEWHPEKLEDFASNAYKRIEPSLVYFPERTTRMFEFMKRDNWFVMYGNLNEMTRILQRIETRSGRGIPISPAVGLLRQHYPAFTQAFTGFMTELKKIVSDTKTA
jgi:acyl carrier protein phosphodiesterase